MGLSKIDRAKAMAIILLLLCPGGGIGIRGRLRAYAFIGVEVRVLSRALRQDQKILAFFIVM